MSAAPVECVLCGRELADYVFIHLLHYDLDSEYENNTNRAFVVKIAHLTLPLMERCLRLDEKQ